MTSSLASTVDRLVREVVPRGFEATRFDPSMTLRGDIGIDSLGLMSLAFRLEEEFEIDLMEHADDVANVQTVGELLCLLSRIQERRTA